MILHPAPLSRAAFAPFGGVIDEELGDPLIINKGFARRFNDVAEVDVAAEGGAVNVSLFAADPRPAPLSIAMMERHPLGSQSFVPLQDRPWLIVVCGDPAEPASFRAFLASGRQGITYARNVWHHPLLVFETDSRFLIIDRKGPGNNLQEVPLAAPLTLRP